MMYGGFTITKLSDCGPLAYVDGNFRFLNSPRPWDYPPMDGTKIQQAQDGSDTGSKDSGNKPQGAKLVHSVKPQLPTASGRPIRGGVQLHAVIAKDGGISWVRTEKEYCSIAEASLAAVKQWRYAPIIVKGVSVEVDTVIDVSFGLLQ